jgi:hypothetical protein
VRENENERIRKKGHAVYDGDGREALYARAPGDDQVPAFFPLHAIS